MVPAMKATVPAKEINKNPVTPIVHRTILISVVAIRFSSLTDVGPVSQPESNAGQISLAGISGASFSLELS